MNILFVVLFRNYELRWRNKLPAVTCRYFDGNKHQNLYHRLILIRLFTNKKWMFWTTMRSTAYATLQTRTDCVLEVWRLQYFCGSGRWSLLTIHGLTRTEISTLRSPHITVAHQVYRVGRPIVHNHMRRHYTVSPKNCPKTNIIFAIGLSNVCDFTEFFTVVISNDRHIA